MTAYHNVAGYSAIATNSETKRRNPSAAKVLEYSFLLCQLLGLTECYSSNSQQALLFSSICLTIFKKKKVKSSREKKSQSAAIQGPRTYIAISFKYTVRHDEKYAGYKSRMSGKVLNQRYSMDVLKIGCIRLTMARNWVFPPLVLFSV